jgi:hypothetical protein
MKPTTIDNLKIDEHVRWAHDQTLLDPIYTQSSPLVEHHPEILWTTTLLTSKWEELFDWQKRNIPFAHFETPDGYHGVSKRLFSYRLFPSIHWKEEDETEEDAPEKAEAPPHHNLLKEVLSLEKNPAQPTALFERDKSHILHLLEEIKELNSQLAQINARKLQYQKG